MSAHLKQGFDHNGTTLGQLEQRQVTWNKAQAKATNIGRATWNKDQANAT
jgi:hypothetical protein